MAQISKVNVVTVSENTSTVQVSKVNILVVSDENSTPVTPSPTGKKRRIVQLVGAQ